ncbi:MAG: hypothetical protein AAF771_02575 [Pseudomonadota bacterium]
MTFRALWKDRIARLERRRAAEDTGYAETLPLGMRAAIDRDAERTKAIAGLYAPRIWL